MNVNYTLPGLPLEGPVAREQAIEEYRPEAFASHLQRFRAPGIVDWRELLNLTRPRAGAITLEPPRKPLGTPTLDAVSQRAWWRSLLAKHSSGPNNSPPVSAMLALIETSELREDQIFARRLAEGGD